MTTVAPVRELQKNYGTKAMALAIGVSVIFLLFGQKAMCRGLVLGAFFSVINFVLMAQTLHLKIKPERTKASISALGNVFFRFAFMAIPLFFAIRFPRFDLMTTIAGLFSVQMVIMGDHILGNYLFSKRK